MDEAGVRLGSHFQKNEGAFFLRIGSGDQKLQPKYFCEGKPIGRTAEDNVFSQKAKLLK
ncbi:hypothetical protein [Ruegeria faecimaris]|uniref:hypothetical protein n=1 Tax=Ruegeria faecimaris TaxID=686389 RepID=UPI00232FCEBD|nr:hypothetical protein [Ruegeria faecimaris]